MHIITHLDYIKLTHLRIPRTIITPFYACICFISVKPVMADIIKILAADFIWSDPVWNSRFYQAGYRWRRACNINILSNQGVKQNTTRCTCTPSSYWLLITRLLYRVGCLLFRFLSMTVIFPSFCILLSLQLIWHVCISLPCLLPLTLCLLNAPSVEATIKTWITMQQIVEKRNCKIA